MQRKMRSFVLAFISALVFGPALAQDFPKRAVTIVVPFPAGGGGDILARMALQKLEAKWGVPVIVDNKPGAGGNIGATAVARAAPDGYTLLLAGSPQFAVNVTLYKNLPYDPVNDFVPLAMAAATPFVLVVNPQIPVKSVAEFIAYAKAQPEPMSYAIGGHVPTMFVDLGPGLGQIQAGGVRALGSSMAKRLEALPGVPPVNDTVPGFDVASWQMYAAPSGTPREIVAKLNADLRSVLDLPDMKEQISRSGMLPLEPGSVEQLRAFVKSEIARWGDVVRKAGIEGSQ